MKKLIFLSLLAAMFCTACQSGNTVSETADTTVGDSSKTKLPDSTNTPMLESDKNRAGEAAGGNTPPEAKPEAAKP